MRIKAARKWIEEQREGARSGARKASDGGGKRRKAMPKAPSSIESEPRTQNSLSVDVLPPPMASKKVVNMSIIHGTGNIAVSSERNSSNFPYKALNVEKSEIRIIILKPGTASSPVECNLKHINPAANSRTRYKALSYTWGPPEATRTMSLDGIQIQDDVLERNEQVSRMGTLYSQAEEVVVWLGPEHNGSDIAISFIRRNMTPPCSGSLFDRSLDSRTSTEIHGILALLHRDYWNRIWIIQEVFKARKITIHCGFETLSWNYLAKFFRMLRQSKKLSQSEKELTALVNNPAVNLTNHRTSRAQDLETLLLAYLESLCCDPRDKVYAVLGLAHNRLTPRSDRVVEHEWLTVDYNRPPSELFRVLTLMYLAEVGDRFTIRWMQLLQKILALCAPWTAPQSPALPANILGHITCQSYHPLSVSQVGPAWRLPPNDKRGKLSSDGTSASSLDLLLKWYRDIAGSRQQFPESRLPSESTFAAALESLSNNDIARLDSFKQVQWKPHSALRRDYYFSIINNLKPSNTIIYPFTTANGRLGLTSCEISSTDDVLRFHGSDIAFVVDYSSGSQIGLKQHVKGRAFILLSDNTLRDQEFSTSYNATFKYAVPSSLDEREYDIGDDTGGAKEIEKYDDACKDSAVCWHPRSSMTLEEWQFWTW